jgi:hypothetical protein
MKAYGEVDVRVQQRHLYARKFYICVFANLAVIQWNITGFYDVTQHNLVHTHLEGGGSTSIRNHGTHLPN